MGQTLLPIFPAGAVTISETVCVQKEGGKVVYYNGVLPVFTHEEGDLASFRLFTTQLIVNGNATIGEIQRAFGVPKGTVKRCLSRYRERGGGAFFSRIKTVRRSQLDDSKTAIAKRLLKEGRSVPEVSKEIGVLQDTIRKAIYAGRLPRALKKTLTITKPQ